mmetsp:Transcript_10795/g.25774  ORF Transcript_10795/g.25774 Transcript_10795/m.25774 type:complete len:526 (+) Transcript_10795:152-1729(+)
MGQTASTTATASSRSSSPPFVDPDHGGRAEEEVDCQGEAQQQRVLVAGDDCEEDDVDDGDYNPDDCETDSYEEEDEYEDDDDDGYDTDDESNDYVESEDVETTDDGGGGTSQQNRRSSPKSTISTTDISQMALVLAELEDHTLSELILTAPLSESRIRAVTTKIKESDQQQQGQDSHVGDGKSSDKGKRHSDPHSSTSSGSLSGSSVTESTLYYSASRAQYLKKNQSSSTSNSRSNNNSSGGGKSRVCGVGGGAASDRRSSASDSGETAGASTVGHTTDDDDDRTVGLCFRILRLSPTMAKMRFKLVPTKCPEHIFWLALWWILFETYQQEQEQHTLTKNKTRTTSSSNRSSSRKKKEDTQGDEACSTLITPRRLDESNNGGGSTINNSPDQMIFKLRRENERLGWTIDDLRTEIDDLKKQLNQQEERQQRTPSPQPSKSSEQVDGIASSSSSLGRHAGTWTMDQDSKDFLSYPPELKQNLRHEKTKRLEEIRQQMKFILDSDNVEDTNGRWSCCGQTSYHGVCK